MRIHRHRQNRPRLQIPEFNTNEDIKAEELRVINEKGEMLGVLKTEVAQKMADDLELDLVEVSPKAEPPVAKILDFSHFHYQKEKEAKKQKATSKEVEIKGVRLSLRIASGDLQNRSNSAKKFLEKGNKVRIEMILRGREKAHFFLAKDIITAFIENIREVYPLRIEQPIKKQGSRVTAIITRE